MRGQSKSFSHLFPLFCFLLFAPSLYAQGTRPPVPYSAYNAWRSIGASEVAQDGNWIAYALVPQDGDGELVVRNLKTTQEYRQPRGNNPKLTADSRFVVFRIAPLKADVDKAKKEARRVAQKRNGHP